MHKSGIQDYYSGLSMHPYMSYYPKNVSGYGNEYEPDECFLWTRASHFWCFKRGVQRVPEFVMQQMESSKLICFTEFRSSGFDDWFSAGLQGQADHLGRAIDIIQTQWPFIRAACVYEYSDYGPTDNREGFFGLLYRNYTIKSSSQVFMRKVKSALFPHDIINMHTPYFSWRSVPDATRYLRWVNDYGIPSVGGKINSFYIPSEAHCPLSNGEYYTVYLDVSFSSQGGAWWVTAFFADDRTNYMAVNGLLFSVQ